MYLARRWQLVLVTAAFRTQAAAAEAADAAVQASNCLTCKPREEDRPELTSVLQVDIQVDHRARQAPATARDAIVGEFGPRPAWFPLALLGTNSSIETWVARKFASSSDELLKVTGGKHTEETTSGGTSTGMMIGLIALAIMGACGLILFVPDRRTMSSINARLRPASRGSPTRTAAGGTMSKGLLSPPQQSARHERSAGPEQCGPERPVLTTKTDTVSSPGRTFPPVVKKKVMGSSPPSPRTLAQMPIPRDSVPDRQVLLCDPSAWLHIEAYFTIQALQFFDVVDSEATGVVDIMRGGMSEPHFVASVQPMDGTPRALMIATAEQRGQPLCSCVPGGFVGGASSAGFCSELELHDNRGRPWGTLVPRGTNTYAICKQGGREALLLEGDQASGRLVVRLGDGEVVAHAAMDYDCTQLEVGVKRHTDPILMLTSVLAILIFNPEDPSNISPEASSK